MGYDGYDAAEDFKVLGELMKVSRDFLEKVAKHLDNLWAGAHTEEGEKANTILAYAKDWQAEIIVMGTHSHGVLEKIWIGPVA